MPEHNPPPDATRYPGTAEDQVEPHEHILLSHGQPKFEEFNDSDQPNTSRFVFYKEDHTLGNLVQQRLCTYDFIEFSGYAIFENDAVTLRVQTDGSITPREAVIRCLRDVNRQLDSLRDAFQISFVEKRAETLHTQTIRERTGIVERSEDDLHGTLDNSGGRLRSDGELANDHA